MNRARCRWTVMTVRLASLLALLLLAACGGGPPPREPGQAQQRALAFAQDARAAFDHGDLSRARELFERALAADVSVEHGAGIAVNALSLARVHQLLGETAVARRYLDRLLDDGEVAPIPRDRRAEAAARRAQLDLDAGDAAAADRMLDRGLEYCAGVCPARTALFNLRARAALARADAAAALQWATQALAGTADDEHHRAERANALRSIGAAQLAAGKAAEAPAPLAQALAIDQDLGLPQRVLSDLLQLARAHAALGERELARGYYARALAAANASGDSAGVRAAQAGLAQK
jgi:Tfp pilus assembly protein PilF